MKHLLLVITTFLAFNTQQTHTMDRFFELVFSWNPSGAQVTTLTTSEKKMVPLNAKFQNITEQEEKWIAQCNGLTPDDHPCFGDKNLHLYQFMAFLEKNATMLETKRGSTLDDSAQLEQYLHTLRPVLQKAFKATYPNTRWGKDYIGNNLADKEADKVIELYAKLRPQLIQKKTHKEYFKIRLDEYNEKIKDLHTLQARNPVPLLQKLYHINKTMDHAGKEEEHDFIKSDMFQKDYSNRKMAWNLYWEDHLSQKQEIGIHPEGLHTVPWKKEEDTLIEEFYKLKKNHPTYASRKAFLVDQYKNINKQYSNIYNRTGFEKPMLQEFDLCAELPTEVRDIIKDNMLEITFSKAHDAHKTL
jgi:hypothetical protein